MATGKRPETGPMQFEGDWPGLFIRGDNAHIMARALENILEWRADGTDIHLVQGLLKDLQSCDTSRFPKPQLMRPFRRCLHSHGLQRTRPDKDWDACPHDAHADDCCCLGGSEESAGE